MHNNIIYFDPSCNKNEIHAFLAGHIETCLSVVFTYSTGAPAARCSSMLPNHGASPQSGDNYNIQVSPNTYGCDSSTVVSVTMTSSAFKGFLCQARTNPSNDITSGTLTNVNDAYTTVNNCAGKASLTHDNNMDKTSIRMEWKPDLTKLDTVYIVCTIVESKMMFWTNQTSAAITFSGNSPCEVDLKKVHEQVFQWSNKYGPVITLHFGRMPVIYVNSIETALEVLVDKSTEFAARISLPSIDLLTNGRKDIAFSSYGPTWKLHRSIAKKALRHYMQGDALEKRIYEAINEIYKVIEKQNADFDPADCINYLITNIMTGICFGGKYEYGDSELQYLMKKEDELFTIMEKGFLEDYFPWLRHIYKTKSFKQFEECITTFRSDFIERKFRTAQIQYDKDNVRHLCDDLLLARYQAKLKMSSVQTDSLTDDHLVQILSDIFFAGIDTSRFTLYWIINHMIAYPDIQLKVQREIDHVVGKDRLPKMSDRDDLCYTEAVLNESMRLASVAPTGVLHMTACDTTIAGYKIKKGTPVVINHWGLHHDSKAWDNVNQFIPERYLDENGKLGPKPVNWLPFSAGVRKCLGEFVAKPEILLLFACLMQRYTWKVLPGTCANLTPTGNCFGLMDNKKLYLSFTIFLSVFTVVNCSTTTRTTIPPTTPTTYPPTTTPTTHPPGSCEWYDEWYPNGATVETDPYNCFFTLCEDGEVHSYDHPCFFSTPPCYGVSERILGQCCPVCHNETTTPRTTIPTTPREGCNVNGVHYSEGETISEDVTYGCYGSICQGGKELTWDHVCMFTTPPCSGTSERVVGQCCPVCHNETTTTPRTTTPPTPMHGCEVDGIRYNEGDTISEDEMYGCYGTFCQGGKVLNWDHICMFHTPTCNGTSERVVGQCCPVCHNETTTPTMTTIPPTPSGGCIINGTSFREGQRINNDPCDICRCLNGTEACSTTECEETLGCETKYRPYGTCCYICGSSMLTMNNPLVILLLTLCIIIRSWN
ncbi:hypothetical protein ACF0H5_014027 [Mactra antiquata]